jgi:hypothetical protein
VHIETPSDGAAVLARPVPVREGWVGFGETEGDREVFRVRARGSNTGLSDIGEERGVKPLLISRELLEVAFSTEPPIATTVG